MKRSQTNSGKHKTTILFVATYLTTGRRKKVMAFSSPMKNTCGSHHQGLFKENIRKTKKRFANFEKKGSGVIYA